MTLFMTLFIPFKNLHVQPVQSQAEEVAADPGRAGLVILAAQLGLVISNNWWCESVTLAHRFNSCSQTEAFCR